MIYDPHQLMPALHPGLQVKLELLNRDYELAYPGDYLYLVQGVRTWASQEQLFLIGRDGQGNVVDPSKIVTMAKPGWSWHEFALAADLVPWSLAKIRGWVPNSPRWAVLAQLAEKNGLTTGACWHHQDLPHVQLTGSFGVTPDDSVRKLYLTGGGCQAVWAASGLGEVAV